MNTCDPRGFVVSSSQVRVGTFDANLGIELSKHLRKLHTIIHLSRAVSPWIVLVSAQVKEVPYI